MSPGPYPTWRYYPLSSRPPHWVTSVVAGFASQQAAIDSTLRLGLNSDAVLSALRPGLTALGFDIEAGKKKSDKIRRPILFGDHGVESLAYEVDGFHSNRRSVHTAHDLYRSRPLPTVPPRWFLTRDSRPS